MDNYSRDLQELIDKHKVNVMRTPKSVMAEQLKAWDVLTKKLSDEDPFFAKVVESQRAWAKRVGLLHVPQRSRLRGSATSTSSRPSCRPEPDGSDS